jgi:hypothetical protein
MMGAVIVGGCGALILAPLILWLNLYLARLWSYRRKPPADLDPVYAGAVAMLRRGGHLIGYWRDDPTEIWWYGYSPVFYPVTFFKTKSRRILFEENKLLINLVPTGPVGTFYLDDPKFVEQFTVAITPW